MKNLARHIELLLRDNDCVILPGFGGFIAHFQPAYYVSEEHLYYPPSRSISFNAALTMNDGLLAQSYMQTYKVDYAQACHLIDIAIDKLSDNLDDNGSATLSHIGTLQQDIHGILQFTPETMTIDSPQFFGLGSFLIHDLAELERKAHNEQGISNAESIITQNEKTINVHINKGFLRHMMSTAAILLLLLMIAIPTGKQQPTDIASLDLSILNTSKTPSAEQAETIIEEASQPILPEVVVYETNEPTTGAIHSESIEPQSSLTETVEASVLEPISTPVPSTATEAPSTLNVLHPEKTYHIIVASLPNHRGAEETLGKYIAKGYTNASLVERDDRVRISLIQYTDKDEANEHLKALRNDPAFQNAWLLAVRNN